MSLADHQVTLNLLSRTPKIKYRARMVGTPVCDCEIAPAAAYVDRSPRLRQPMWHRSPARETEIDLVTGELISGNMAAVVRGSYFGLENSTRLSSSSPACPLPSASCLPRRCNQVEQLKYCDEERLIARENVNFTRRYVLLMITKRRIRRENESCHRAKNDDEELVSRGANKSGDHMVAAPKP